MTRPIQLDKTYGVLHTENYFSFLGFAKKVGSDEIQKIDVFLDDKLIDTIEANEFIQQIDDIYDVENKAFKYNLPSEHIGKKAIISFKNHDSGEELINSPYTLIDKNHEDFNEAKFLHSLSEPLSEELKNMYKTNCVGFLATKENLEDTEFVKYINKIIRDFPNADFKALYFNKKDEKKIKEKFIAENLEYLQIKEIKDIFENLEMFLSNYGKTFIITENKLYQYLFNNSNEIIPLGLNLNIDKNTSIKEYSKSIDNYYSKFFENLELFGFNQNDIKKYGNSFIEVYYKKAIEKYQVDIIFNVNNSVRDFIYIFLKISLRNHNFLKDLVKFRNKYHRV